MLEKMSDFFENRLSDYDHHQLTCITAAETFYPFTAQCLPQTKDSKVLDLGCGTGLELEYYFKINPSAKITGIDLSSKMLKTLKAKFPERNLSLICDSYFVTELGCGIYDAAVSVESLHHFTQAEKIPLYQKLFRSLKPNGYFILTDYLAIDDQDEQSCRNELLRLKKLQRISDNEFYHYDTPLTVDHEIIALQKGGFSKVKILGNWENTYTLKAIK